MYVLKDENGRSITLTNEEIRKIFYAREREYIRNDIEGLLMQWDYLNLEEDSIDSCIEEFYRIRDKCDAYYDIYWLCIEEAIENTLKEEEK